jgi:hypothetical protein
MSKRDPTFEKLQLLDRLEELLEDMDDLGIASRDELEARIREVEADIDDQTDEDAHGSV